MGSRLRTTSPVSMTCLNRRISPSTCCPGSSPNSFATAAAQFGHDLRIAHPKGYELDLELLADIEKLAVDNGGSVKYSHDPTEAFDGADVVYA